MSRYLWLLLLTVLLASGCGERGLPLPSLSDDADVSLETVADGAVLTRGDRVEATILVGPEGREPDRIEVSFVSQDGRTVAADTIMAAEMERGRLPAISVAELETGYYTLRFDLFAGGRKTAEYERKIFVSAAPFRIAGISAYPPTFMTDSKGILRADLDIPPQTDPYIRWSFNGKTVSQGLLSAGAAELLLHSPQREGVYAVQLELFPVAPHGSDYEFSSQVLQRTELVVRDARLSPGRGFGPPQSYYVLLHLAGNTRDSGMRAELVGREAAKAEATGAAGLRMTRELFGYYLDGAAGIRFDEVILPFRSHGFEPFSVAMLLVLTEPQHDRVLFRTEAADSSFGLRVELADGGELRARLRVGERSETLTTEGAAVQPGRPVEINLALVPRGAATSLLWLIDGKPVAAAELPLRLPRPADDGGRWIPPAGSSVIGGEGGFVGVIDEFGIFFRDDRRRPAANTAPFRFAQTRIHGEALILAEGFESALLPERFAERGAVSLRNGSAVVDPGSALIGPELEFNSAEITLELTTAANPEAALRVELWSIDDDVHLLSHSVAGAGVVSLHMEHRGERLRMSFAGQDELEMPVPDGFNGVRLETVNDSATEELRVESLVAYHGSRAGRRSIHVP